MPDAGNESGERIIGYMGGQDKNEMEEIQRGLEAFLEKELDVIGSRQQAGEGKAPKTRPVRNEELFRNTGYFSEDWDAREPEPYPDEELETYSYQGEEEIQGPVLDMIGGVREAERPGNAGRERKAGEPRRRRYPQEAGDFRQRQVRYAGKEQGEEEEPYQEESYSRRGDRTKKRVRKQSQKKEQHGQEEDSRMRKDEGKAQKSSRKRGRRKKHRLRKFLIIAALIFALLGFGWYQLVGVIYAKMIYHGIDSVADAPLKEDGAVNILLIGNDSRMNGEDGRSDAMILLSISSRTKKIYMTSLLRDIYVDIPGYQGNRLNAAYSFGGAELLMETIEENFDIPVNRYVLVNFEAFANLVDAVDGIELELSTEEIEYVNGYLVEYNMLTDRPQGTDNMDTSVSGLVHLNGPQALAYCRNRYLGTDFGRTERQRKVLTAVIGKLPSNILTGAGELVNGLLPNLTTNLTRNECFRLSLMAGKLFTYEIVPDSIPLQGTYWNENIRGMEVLGVDFDSNIKYLKEKIYGE